MTSEGNQKSLADILLGREVPGITLHQIALAIEQERGDLLLEIIDQFFRHVAESRKKTAADVTTAVPLSEETRKKLEKFLSELVGEGVLIKMSVDPSILGGLVVRIGQQIIDGSIRGQLSRLREGISRDILTEKGVSH